MAFVYHVTPAWILNLGQKSCEGCCCMMREGGLDSVPLFFGDTCWSTGSFRVVMSAGHPTVFWDGQLDKRRERTREKTNVHS